MIAVLDFIRPFPSEDRWDADFVLAKDDAADTMGQSITHTDVVRPPPNKFAASSWGLMILKATSGSPLLQPVEQDCAGGRQAVVLIALFCCMG